MKGHMIFLSRPSKTGRELARRLDFQLLYHARNVPSGEEVIRWGNTEECNFTSYNSRKSILTVSNKYQFLKKMSDNGIPTPQVNPSQFPMIGRKYHHEQGRAVFYVENQEEKDRAIRKGAEYFMSYYPRTEEYRVHIGFGRCILMSERFGDSSEKVWNKRLGAVYRHMPRSEWRLSPDLMNIVRSCKQAIELSGLDFGAIDVLANPSNPQPYVLLEINSAPALSPLAIGKYVEMFKDNIAS